MLETTTCASADLPHAAVGDSATPLRQRYAYCAANLVVLWLAVFIYRTNHYYLRFLSDLTQQVILWLAVGYSAFAVVWYGLRRNAEPTHAFLALLASWRWLASAGHYLRQFPDNVVSPRINSEERISLLFIALKFFYLPMMIEFVIANGDSLQARWWSYSGVWHMPRLTAFNDFVFPCLIDVFFILECVLYAFGYAFESRRLKNRVKSIEPTMLGWVSALACYPPGNAFVNNYVSWFTSDEPAFANPLTTALVRVAVLLCFAFYLWGAISLGTKCSNLTNRGIVKRGAFSWVRHPAYAAKNLAWWIGLLPNLSLPAVLSMLFWTMMYGLRALTEERHLAADPDYQDYCRRTRWRFIPGIF